VSARPYSPGSIDNQNLTDLRQGLDIRKEAMQPRIVLDLLPIEPASAIIDPREHQCISLKSTERMLVQLTGPDPQSLLGLDLDKPEVLPGGDRQQQQRYRQRRSEKSSRWPSQPPARTIADRTRPTAGQSPHGLAGKPRPTADALAGQVQSPPESERSPVHAPHPENVLAACAATASLG
jgi:hypothetical protein